MYLKIFLNFILIVYLFFCIVGVSNLRSLLAGEKDEDAPKLNILLCEAFVATYMALSVYALATCDCHILYRLVGQNFTNQTWATLFGGGVKKLLRVAHTSVSIHIILFFSVRWILFTNTLNRSERSLPIFLIFQSIESNSFTFLSSKIHLLVSSL